MHYMHKKNFKFKPELSGNLGEHGQKYMMRRIFETTKIVYTPWKILT